MSGSRLALNAKMRSSKQLDFVDEVLQFDSYLVKVFFGAQTVILGALLA
jgi:hypothetical protein